MKNLTAAKAAEILVAIYKVNGVKTIDSHRIERDMMAHFPIAFMQDFIKYTGNSDPLHSFSLNFGAWIEKD